MQPAAAACEAIRCSRALVGGELREDYAFVVEDGTIVAAGDYRELHDAIGDAPVRAFPSDRLIVPGFVNGHSHAYQILLRGWADDLPFETWRSDALYMVVPRLEPDDIYWVFVLAFSEMLAAGITTVAEFFYLNGSGNAHAEAAIRAARDTGIRLVFARTWMDAPSAPPEFRETIERAASRTDDLRARFPDVAICVAPHSLHAASLEMVRAAAEYARVHDCKLHIHVAEAPYEGERTVAEHGAPPVELLDRLGALSERTVAVHAIYVSDDEKRLLAVRGASVIHNPMTNQYLGDGICDVVGFQTLGVPVGLGTDADVKPSVLDEMRAAALLQKVRRCDGAALGARTAFEMGTAQGARALGIPAGDLVAGLRADFVALDTAGIDPWSPACNAVVYRGESAWVQATFVGGRRVFAGEPAPLALQARERVAAIAKRLFG
jgi:5-methylthioadenosine/S-adenosylhomocysteine deaminase